MKQIQVIDDFIHRADAAFHRERALRATFRSVQLGADVFHGIALPDPDPVVMRLLEAVPGFTPTVSFIRQSPEGQVEPNYVHSDEMMGDLTAIYYMNPHPPAVDGTSFWTHRPTQTDRGPWAAIAGDAKDPQLWDRRQTVLAQFNRVLLFKSDLYHSRAIAENYGQGDDARLIQVVFGTLNQPAWED